jgi:hypothetical protein
MGRWFPSTGACAGSGPGERVNVMRCSRRVFAPFLLFTVLGWLVSAPAGAAMAGGDVGSRPGDDDGPDVRLTAIGEPRWKPVDMHQFSAPIGTAASGYGEFTATMLALLPEPNHRFHPDLGVGAGSAAPTAV